MRWVRLAAPMIILAMLLGGCGLQGGGQAEELVAQIQKDYREMDACTAELTVTADYGQRVYEYTLQASYEKEKETTLTVTQPENIAGVTAHIRDGETALEYDGAYLETGALSETGLSPIDAFPALLSAAREGYIAHYNMETLSGAQALRVLYRNPEAEEGTGQEETLWYDPDTGVMLRGEIALDGYTVIQCDFTAFSGRNADS
ncbi:MAG: hypothetical protein LUG13_05340 [Oscillospiraceae bacterium]|nr:hypothetical protein [Oscillospiraceae bacterium]